MSISRFVSDFLHRLTSTPAYSRYAAYAPAVIRRCQQFHRAGRDMGLAIPGMSPVEATVIVVESQEADLLAKTSPEGLLQTPLDRCSDWALAVVAEILLTTLQEMKDKGSQDMVMMVKMEVRAWKALEQALLSPRASPLLFYGEIFVELGRWYERQNNRRALDLFRRALAHNLRYDDEEDTVFFLRELAESYLGLGEVEAGMRLFAGLVRNDPADLLTYRALAHSSIHAGLFDLTLLAARRGLAFIAEYGGDEDVQEELQGYTERYKVMDRRRRKVAVGALAEVQAALQTGFEEGLEISGLELCRQLIPDFDAIPVKAPPALPGEGGMAVRPVAIRKRRTRIKEKTLR